MYLVICWWMFENKMSVYGTPCLLTAWHRQVQGYSNEVIQFWVCVGIFTTSFLLENTFTMGAFICIITVARVLVWLIDACGTIHARITCTFVNIWKIEVEQVVFHSYIGCHLSVRIENMFEPVISQNNFENHRVWLLRTMSASGMALTGIITSKYGIQRVSMHSSFWDVEHIYDFCSHFLGKGKYLFRNGGLHIRYHKCSHTDLTGLHMWHHSRKDHLHIRQYLENRGRTRFISQLHMMSFIGQNWICVQTCSKLQKLCDWLLSTMSADGMAQTGTWHENLSELLCILVLIYWTYLWFLFRFPCGNGCLHIRYHKCSCTNSTDLHMWHHSWRDH